MTDQLFPRPRRRMRQPRKDVLRDELARAATEIEQQRATIDHLERVIETTRFLMGWNRPPRAPLPWWRRLLRITR
jgi:hypothetical protein